MLARIHRLTINRLRAEIEAVSVADFQRFLLAWQRVSAEHRAEGPEGVQAVLELLDGFELPAAAWEPEVLARRVNNYTPAWLDQLCFTGRIGWSRLRPPQTANGRPATPVRSSPISIYARANLPHWLSLSAPPPSTEFSPDATHVLEMLDDAGALFFGEIVKRTGSAGLTGRECHCGIGRQRLGHFGQLRRVARPARAGREEAVLRAVTTAPTPSRCDEH